MNRMKTFRISILAAAASLLALPVLGNDISCQDVEWDPAVLERFPDLEQGCQEVVLREGQLLARFEARLVRTRSNGDVKIKLKMNDGSYVERTFHAPSDFKVATANGSKMRIFELERGEILDIYISGDNFSLAGTGDTGAGLSMAPVVEQS